MLDPLRLPRSFAAHALVTGQAERGLLDCSKLCSLPFAVLLSLHFYYFMDNRVSASEPFQCHVLSVRYVRPWYVMAGMVSSAGHLYCALLLPLRVPIVLPHFIFHPKVRRCLSDADRGRGEGQPLKLTRDERPTTLCYLCIATLLMLTPQCSTFT